MPRYYIIIKSRVIIRLLDLIDEYSNCTDNEIQLVNGPSPNEGTLQICHNGAWGVLCYNRFSSVINQAVCNQLGFQKEGDSFSFCYII